MHLLRGVANNIGCERGAYNTTHTTLAMQWWGGGGERRGGVAPGVGRGRGGRLPLLPPQASTTTNCSLPVSWFQPSVREAGSLVGGGVLAQWVSGWGVAGAGMCGGTLTTGRAGLFCLKLVLALVNILLGVSFLYTRRGFWKQAENLGSHLWKKVFLNKQIAYI